MLTPRTSSASPNEQEIDHLVDGIPHWYPAPLERPVAEWVMARHGWAFPSPRKPGEHVTPDCVARRLKRILSGYSAHTLRHHYATEAYQESGDLLATQLLLGHRSPVTTIGYVQQDPARLRKAAAATWVA